MQPPVDMLFSWSSGGKHIAEHSGSDTQKARTLHVLEIGILSLPGATHYYSVLYYSVLI